jgi:hypothetical protein
MTLKPIQKMNGAFDASVPPHKFSPKPGTPEDCKACGAAWSAPQHRVD